MDEQITVRQAEKIYQLLGSRMDKELSKRWGVDQEIMELTEAQARYWIDDILAEKNRDE